VLINHVTVIAEAGVNHNGCMDRALKMIDAAADAGADYVKFQTFRADRLVTKDAMKAAYQQKTSGTNESQFDMLRRLELSLENHNELINHCDRRNIQFFSTAFDIASIELLVELGLPLFKIPSGEITNVPYLRRIGSLRKPVLLSTGMATMAEIEFAIDTLEQSGVARNNLTVLHCNTEYPTPMSDVNLRAMQSIRDAFKVSVGYSDHTQGTEVSIAAVALGATVIEKHFTMDRALPGPDHEASLEPAEFKAMVTAIRNIEQALGDGIKRPSPSEFPNRFVARKSIIAAVDIRKGETFTAQTLTVKRPGTGICPSRWDEVVGRTASRDYCADELIQW
jgi:N,N'-diacetyllegionaminate synthase